MNDISDRIKLMASFVKPGESVADIGSDHGYLPAFLVSSGITDKLIITDVNEEPLKRAKSNMQQFAAGSESDFRLGDGLKCIEPGEVDNVVIAGMGGILIADILGHDTAKTKSYNRLILQPRNNAAVVRKWLDENDFIITQDRVVMENGHFCQVISAVLFGRENAEESMMARTVGLEEEMAGVRYEILYEFPVRWIIDRKQPAIAYMFDRLVKENEIVRSIYENGNPQQSADALLSALEKRAYLVRYFPEFAMKRDEENEHYEYGGID